MYMFQSIIKIKNNRKRNHGKVYTKNGANNKILVSLNKWTNK